MTSSLTTITVPKDYGYVVATTVASFFVGFLHGAYTRPFRLRAKVRAPCAFADSAEIAASNEKRKKDLYLFNCAQRAHANYLETQPSTALALLIAGLRYPQAAYLLGIGWLVGRVIFTLGYTRADQQNGSGRMIGFAIQLPMQLALWGMAFWTGIKLAS